MKDFVIELASKQTSLNAKLNIMREYLQAYILRLMYEEGTFRTTGFLGGTALRFLYNLPRFSEDLDFSLVKRSRLNFPKLLKKIKSELILSGYKVYVNYNDEKNVYNAFIKFEGLMHEVGISPLKNQRFSIKLEIDTRPPEGAFLETRVINKYFPLAFLSYDLSSLFAGKLHALLNRKYTKGRDFFDLGWYLSKWPELSPNIVFLNNALNQTGWNRGAISLEKWRELIYEMVQKANWKRVKQDVVNFLENRSDIEIFSKENVLRLLEHSFI